MSSFMLASSRSSAIKNTDTVPGPACEPVQKSNVVIIISLTAILDHTVTGERRVILMKYRIRTLKNDSKMILFFQKPLKTQGI